ncbi:MAG: alpha/beta hydrolase fold protein [Mucilaginibacter sp.]|nr:alpha/beta hydrolase fold protein [Mucilaginibacter sp.]
MIYSKTKGNSNKYILFFHGNSQSHETWDAVINEELLDDFTLLTVDLPGHGKSFHSIRPEIDYTLKGMSVQIKELILSYQEFEYIIVANSIATNFIAEIAPGLLNCKGLFLTGACIIGGSFTTADVFQLNPNLAAAFAAYPADEELNLLLDDMAYQISDELKQKCKNTFLNTDPLFRTTLNESITAEDWSDEIENLENMDIPIAIVYGKNEKINHFHYLNRSNIKKWENETLLIPDAGHCIQLDQPKLLAAMINDFAQYCFK